MENEEHEGPKLTAEGAQLLAKVVNSRAAGRHSTLTAQRNKLRRQNDQLRTPPDVDLGMSDSEQKPSRPEKIEYTEHEPESDEFNRGWLLAPAFVALVVVACVLLAMTLQPNDTTVEAQDTAVEQVEADEADEADDVGDFDSDPANIDVAPAAADTEIAEVAENDLGEDDAQEVADVDVAGVQEVAPAVEDSESPTDVSVVASEIEVMVYDSTSEGEVFSFALRLQNLGESEIPTDGFMVVIENADGEVAEASFVRFLHDMLPAGSSALASVRAEGTAAGEQFVSVSFEGLEIVRKPLRG